MILKVIPPEPEEPTEPDDPYPDRFSCPGCNPFCGCGQCGECAGARMPACPYHDDDPEPTQPPARSSGMAFVIMRKGSGLMLQAGSSFGGMAPAKREVDTYLKNDDTWTEQRGEAHKFGQRVAAENKLAALPNGAHEIVEE